MTQPKNNQDKTRQGKAVRIGVKILVTSLSRYAFMPCYLFFSLPRRPSSWSLRYICSSYQYNDDIHSHSFPCVYTSTYISVPTCTYLTISTPLKINRLMDGAIKWHRTSLGVDACTSSKRRRRSISCSTESPLRCNCVVDLRIAVGIVSSSHNK